MGKFPLRSRITTADDGNAQWERARSHGRRPPRRVTGERNAPRGRGVSSDIETAGSDDIETADFRSVFYVPRLERDGSRSAFPPMYSPDRRFSRSLSSGVQY